MFTSTTAGNYSLIYTITTTANSCSCGCNHAPNCKGRKRKKSSAKRTA